MSRDKIQMAFRVEPKLYDRINSEAIKRELTIQDMVIAALKLYWKTPKEWDYAETTFVTLGDDVAPEVVEEHAHWLTLWGRYVREMPDEKTRAMVAALEWDLRMKQSSRAKSGIRRSRKARTAREGRLQEE